MKTTVKSRARLLASFDGGYEEKALEEVMDDFAELEAQLATAKESVGNLAKGWLEETDKLKAANERAEKLATFIRGIISSREVAVPECLCTRCHAISLLNEVKSC